MTEKAAGGGWALFGATGAAIDVLHEWNLIAEVSFDMPRHATITVCELEACVWGVAFYAAMCAGIGEAHRNLATWVTADTKQHQVLQIAQKLE